MYNTMENVRVSLLSILLVILLPTTARGAPIDNSQNEVVKCPCLEDKKPTKDNDDELDIANEIDNDVKGNADTSLPHDCQELKEQGLEVDGVYIIYPGGRKTFVWCNGMSGNDTAWTLVQRRRDGKQKFKKGWLSYKRGFGQREVDHWIGNEVLHLLTSTYQNVRYDLRIELTTWETPAVVHFAEYSNFKVASEDDFYRLSFDEYSGNAGDSLQYNNGHAFSTPDAGGDHDDWPGQSCAAMFDSGWWFSDCGAANLNGQFYRGEYNAKKDGAYRGGIWWFGNGTGTYTTSFQSVMKVKPVRL